MPKFSSTFLQFLLLLVGSSTGRIPSLILDTDMDFDVDDVGALCLAHSLQVYTYSLQLDHTKGILCKSRQWNLGIWGLPLVLDDLDTFKDHDFFNLDVGFCLQDLGEAELLAVVHSTGYPTAIGAVSVINHFFGRDDILLGAFKGDFGKEVNDPAAFLHRCFPFILVTN